MKKSKNILLFILLSCLFFTYCGVQAEVMAECDKCKRTGRLLDRKAKVCAKFFDKGFLPIADSGYMRWPKSYGTGYKPCPYCKYGLEWKKKLDERKVKCDALIAGRKVVMDKIFGDKYPRRKIYHAQSEHFRISYNCLKKSGRGVICDEHTVGWLLLSWCEETYSLFEEFVGVVEPKEGEKKEVLKFFDDQPRCFYIWAGTESQKKAAQALAGTYNIVSCVYSPFFCTMVEHEFSEHTDHYVVHQGMQLLVDGLEPWQDRTKPEWLINGVGNWAEWELFEECNIAAIGEGQTPWDISIPDFGWPSNVLKLVKSKRAVPFSELANSNIKELDTNKRVQSFGVIDFLFRVYGGKNMRKFLIRIKETKDQFRALKEVYELTPDMLDEVWEEWVKKNYKKYKKRKRGLLPEK